MGNNKQDIKWDNIDQVLASVIGHLMKNGNNINEIDQIIKILMVARKEATDLIKEHKKLRTLLNWDNRETI